MNREIKRGRKTLEEPYIYSRYANEYVNGFSKKKAAVVLGITFPDAERLHNIPEVKKEIDSAVEEINKRNNLNQDLVIGRLLIESDIDDERTTPGGRVKALELLSRHLGMLKTVVTGEDGGPIKLEHSIVHQESTDYNLVREKLRLVHNGKRQDTEAE